MSFITLLLPWFTSIFIPQILVVPGIDPKQDLSLSLPLHTWLNVKHLVPGQIHSLNFQCTCIAVAIFICLNTESYTVFTVDNSSSVLICHCPIYLLPPGAIWTICPNDQNFCLIYGVDLNVEFEYMVALNFCSHNGWYLAHARASCFIEFHIFSSV